MLWGLCAATALASVATTARAADEADKANIYRRLAVIGSPALQRSGLTELLSNELQQGGAELVEREQLNAVVQEQTLAASLGAEDAGRRTNLGRLVKADVLVLVNEDGSGKDRRAQVIVAECRQGARLSSATFPIGGVPELARAIAAHVLRTRARFAGGLKGMVGVSPFIAKNFTYEWHPLQAGYAVLLREAVTAIPGVAVVEVEEAQAIRRELATSGGQSNGVVPVFVEGEFEVTTPPGKPPAIEMTVTFKTADKSRSISRHALSLEAASRFVSRELPSEVMPDYHESADKPFTPDAEFKNLVARADEFASLGEWRHSADLRQAALVIHPGDIEQRGKLVDESLAVVSSLRTSTFFNTGTPQWERLVGSSIDYYRAALEGTEWQIRRYREHPVGNPVYGGCAIEIIWMVHSQAADRAMPIKREFLLHAYPLTWDPKWEHEKLANPLLDRRYSWVEVLMMTAMACNDKPLTKDDYDVLVKLLNEVIPDNMEPSHRLTDLLWQPNPSFVQARSNPAFLDFLRELEQSDKPLNRILSREAMLAWRVGHGKRDDVATLAEVEKLRADYAALGIPPGPIPNTALVDELNRIRDLVTTKQIATTGPGGLLQGAAEGLGGRPALTRPSDEAEAPASIESGVLRFEKMPLAHKNRSGPATDVAKDQTGYVSGFRYLVACTEAFDVTWDDHRINFLREPGVLEDVFPNRGVKPIYGDVAWDGRHLWVATLRDGLWVVDSGGTVVTKVGEAEGLPPCDQAVRVQVLGPDRLLVAGSFGPSMRGFLALVEKDDAGYRVNVFHKGTHTVEKSQGGLPIFDADLAFTPSMMTRCQSRDGQGDFAVIYRDGCTVGAVRHPLIVNLKKLTVAPSDDPMPPLLFLGCNGGILLVTEVGELIFVHPSADGHGFTTDHPPLLLPRGQGISMLDSWGGPNSRKWMVGPDGQVYLFGHVWFRLDTATMKACRLADTETPADVHWWLNPIASSHLGFAALGFASRKNGLYRISVDEARLKDLPRAAWYQPPPSRELAAGVWVYGVKLTVDPLSVGGHVAGKILVRRATRYIGSFRLATAVYRGKDLLSNSSVRVTIPNEPALDTELPWEAHGNGAIEGSAAPFLVPGPGEYRIEITLQREDGKGTAMDQQAVILSTPGTK